MPIRLATRLHAPATQKPKLRLAQINLFPSIKQLQRLVRLTLFFPCSAPYYDRLKLLLPLELSEHWVYWRRGSEMALLSAGRPTHPHLDQPLPVWTLALRDPSFQQERRPLSGWPRRVVALQIRLLPDRRVSLAA